MTILQPGWRYEARRMGERGGLPLYATACNDGEGGQFVAGRRYLSRRMGERARLPLYAADLCAEDPAGGLLPGRRYLSRRMGERVPSGGGPPLPLYATACCPQPFYYYYSGYGIGGGRRRRRVLVSCCPNRLPDTLYLTTTALFHPAGFGPGYTGMEYRMGNPPCGRQLAPGQTIALNWAGPIPGTLWVSDPLTLHDDYHDVDIVNWRFGVCLCQLSGFDGGVGGLFGVPGGSYYVSLLASDGGGHNGVVVPGCGGLLCADSTSTIDVSPDWGCDPVSGSFDNAGCLLTE